MKPLASTDPCPAARRRLLRAPAPGRRRSLFAALTLALALAGCGPGVGGTGTGGDAAPALSDFGATAAPLCDSAVAGALRCVPPAASGGSAQTLPVWLSDADPAQRALALIVADEIELQLRCDGWRFQGRWGRTEADVGRFYGQAQAPEGTPLGATLTLDTTAGGLLATLRRADGVLLAPPVLLLDRSGPPAAGDCPG